MPARILQRVIRVDRGLRRLRGARPLTYPIAGAKLATIVDGPELRRLPGAAWPATALLIAQPDGEVLANNTPELILTGAWRLLFRARVEHELRQALESGTIDEPGLDARIRSVGRTEFEEAGAVLRQDGLLPPPVTELDLYTEFAAVFLELSCFDPVLRPIVFPAIECPDAVEAVLVRDLDAKALLAATKLEGAPEPAARAPAEEDVNPSDLEPNDETVTSRAGAELRMPAVATRAAWAAERGNSVRAAILWTQLAQQSGPLGGQAERSAAASALRQLAVRLRKALFVQKGEAGLWVRAMSPLLQRAAREFWSPERRLLHDLQNVCLDHEREVFRLEPIGWLLSMGRRSLKHPLPHLREVTMSKHLRSAATRLRQARLAHHERVRLEGLLYPAVHRAEADLRKRFRPWVDATLDSEWVRPGNLPERVAYRKLVEELIDPIVSRGFTNLGTIRDAASRGNLKLPDLSSAEELLRGDRLLRADRALAQVLDGVHRRGEIYLRWLQRFSACAFGTPAGRFLTHYLALPFGGAFVLLKGLEEINEVMIARFTGAHAHLVTAPAVLVLGTIALGFINYAWFRRQFLSFFGVIATALHRLIVELPAWLLAHPLVLLVISSAPVRAAWRFVLKPGLVAAPLWALAWFGDYSPAAAGAFGLLAFLAAVFVFNTDAGRRIEEIAVERVSHAGRTLVFGVLPGLFRIIMAAFDRLRDWVEKLLYAVDEWLRFREGQSQAVLAIKAAIGVVWSVVAYVVRIYLNLLVEPQLNPIKHFPVVTVAAKIMLPFALTFTRIVAAPLAPFLGSVLANAVAAGTVFFFPGVFGFLVWELRSNWRLYDANRPESLGPVAVGSHGETVVRFLRPGFHSGTLPKLFARLRRARQVGKDAAALKQRAGLHHVEEAVRRLVERDFTALLHQSRALGNWSVEPGSIRLATNRIRIELLAAGSEVPSLWIDLEERLGVLAAGVSRPGWLARLDAEERLTLAQTLAGLYKISGVELVHGPGDRVPASSARPSIPGVVLESKGPVEFARVEIPWRSWVDAWEAEASTRPECRECPWREGVLPPPVQALEPSRGRASG
jgi:hypothetical protein